MGNFRASTLGLFCALSACVPSTGSTRALVSQAFNDLARHDYAAASKKLEAADANHKRDPDPEAFDAAGRARVQLESGVLAQAITHEGALDNDHLDAVAALHKLRARVTLVSADAALRDEAAWQLNQRASFAIERVERNPQADIKPVLTLGQYPELAADNRQRLEALRQRAVQVHTARATESASSAVRRLHQGLAQGYGAPAAPAFDVAAVPEIFGVERATTTTAQLAPACGGMAAAIKAVERKGGYAVDAQVSLSRCETGTRQQARLENYEVVVEKMRMIEKEFKVTTCEVATRGEIHCDSFNCVKTKYAGEQTCSTSTKIEMVPEYYLDKETRQREVMDTLQTLVLEGSLTVVERGQAGRAEPLRLTAEGTLAPDGAQLLTQHLIAKLDAPIAVARAAKAQALAAGAVAALRAGKREEAEHQASVAVLLGATEAAPLTQPYGVTVAQIRAAFAVPQPVAVAAAEPEPVITPLARQRPDFAWLLEGKQALLEPTIGRTSGLSYMPGLGALQGDKIELPDGSQGAGEWAPALELRIGFPLIGRLNRRHGWPVGIYDELSFSAIGGYRVAGASDDARSQVFAGLVRYALAAGIRTSVFSLIGGMRAAVAYANLGDSKGDGWSAPWYGQLAFRTGPTALAIEAWYPSGYGARAFGGSVLMVSRGRREDKHNGMFGIRVERSELDGCAAMAGGGCMDVTAWPVSMYSLVFGVGF